MEKSASLAADSITSENQFKLCLSTIDCESGARVLAKKLLQQKLVACVNISSKMTSMYSWQDKLTEQAEFLLLMKTSSQKVAELQDTLLELHPYDVPEFIVIDIKEGATDYLNWINSTLS